LPISGGTIERRVDRVNGPRLMDAVDEQSAKLFTAQLKRGAITELADWALIEFDAGVEVTAIHQATGSAAPLKTRTKPLTPGTTLFQWAGGRGLIPGRLKSPDPEDLTLRLPDNRQAYYRRIFYVEWGTVEFSLPGESGSLVIAKDLSVVGVVLGGSMSQRLSFVLPVENFREPLGNDFSSFFTR
jgi:hypothetical protein